MKDRTLEAGDVVQINPEHPYFGGFLCIVTEPKKFGCQGYLLSASNFTAIRADGKAYVRLNFKDMEFIGTLQWIEKEAEDGMA